MVFDFILVTNNTGVIIKHKLNYLPVSRDLDMILKTGKIIVSFLPEFFPFKFRSSSGENP